MENYIKITQVKSSIGRLPKHKLTICALGLRYIGHTVYIKNVPSNIGMINRISYMLKVHRM